MCQNRTLQGLYVTAFVGNGIAGNVGTIRVKNTYDRYLERSTLLLTTRDTITNVPSSVYLLSLQHLILRKRPPRAPD